MSMLQLDFRLPEFGNLVKDLGLEDGGRRRKMGAQREVCTKPCRQLPHGRDPVSYTHLDVYKRQSVS